MKFRFGFGDVRTGKFWRAIAAEFLGCAFFVLCVTCAGLPWATSEQSVSANHLEMGLGVGLSITTLAYAFGHVSGGHLNPAVSLAMVTGGRMAVVQGFMYIIAQLAGGIVGSALTYICTSNRTTYRDLAVNVVSEEVTASQGVGLELLFTFLLVFYIFSVTDPAKKTEPINAALGIGITIVVCHVCLIPLTGCSLNPARSFGPAVITDKWANHWVFWVGPLAGGVLASIFYNLVFYADDEKPNDYIETNGHVEEIPRLRLETSAL